MKQKRFQKMTIKNTTKYLLAVGITLTTLLVGCGMNQTPPLLDEVIESEEEKSQVTLRTVSMYGGENKTAYIYRDINNQLMEKYSNLTIEDTSSSSNEEWKASVNADFAVGNEPDVIHFFTDATADMLVKTGKLVTIEEIRAEYPEYAQDTLDTALEAAVNTDGVLRAVPTSGYWEGLFCNKDLFEQYGVALPTDWDSLVTAIGVFKANGIVPIACSLNNVPHYWIEFLMLYSSGVEEFTQVPETAPEGWVKGLDLIKTLRDMGAFPTDTDVVDDVNVCRLFMDKKAAMQLSGSWYVADIEDTENTVVIAFPGVPDQKVEDNTMLAGISVGFYITRKAWDDPEKREMAVKFVMAHTCQESAQRYWESIGGASQATVEVTPIEDATPLAQSIADYINSAGVIVAPTDARIGDAYKTLVANIVKLSKGMMSSEDAINEALDTMK